MRNEDGEVRAFGNPRNFGDIVGQDLLIAALRQNLLEGTGVDRHLAFVGRPGSGKKTIARLYSQAIICDSPAEDGSPCQACAECKGVRSGGSWSFVPIDASRQGDEDAVRTLVERDRTLNTAAVRIVLIDHAEKLEPPAADAALKTLERDTRTVFIFLVNEDQAFSGALRSRCNVFRMRPLDTEEMVKHLAAACERGSMGYEAAMLELVARLAEGRYGAALTSLAAVQGEGATTVSSALRVLGLCWGSAALHCHRLMLAERFDEAADCFDRIGRDGPSRIRAMQALSVELELRHELGRQAPAVGPALAAVSADEWAEVEGELKRFGQRNAVAVGELVSGWARFWRDVRLDVPAKSACQRFAMHLRRWSAAESGDPKAKDRCGLN